MNKASVIVLTKEIDKSERFYRIFFDRLLGRNVQPHVLAVDFSSSPAQNQELEKRTLSKDFCLHITQSNTAKLPTIVQSFIADAEGNWLCILDDFPTLPLFAIDQLHIFLDRAMAHDVAMFCISLRDKFSDDAGLDLPKKRDALIECSINDLGDFLTQAPLLCLFRLDWLRQSHLIFDPDISPRFQFAAFTARYLMRYADKRIIVLSDSHGMATVKGSKKHSSAHDWRNPVTYDATLKKSYLQLLEEAARILGSPPQWLQQWVLRDLAWYFETDRRARAPTVIVTEPMAEVFHDLVRQIIQRIDLPTIFALGANECHPEVQHALLSYKEQQMHSAVGITAYDHAQGLVCLNYFIHGALPTESIRLDDVSVKPAYAKYRACRFFRRTLFRERIAWLQSAGYSSIQVELDNQPTCVMLGVPQVDSTQRTDFVVPNRLLDLAREHYPAKTFRSQLPLTLRGLKARILKWIAGLPYFQARFAKAWVFLDRLIDADDNAEHLYRWIRQHHPEINAWFLLNRDASDWKRLKADGFRLIAPSLLERILLLNSEQIASSHPEYIQAGFDPILYGDRTRWRYTFLHHGIMQNDMSHWLNELKFDCCVAGSPPEYAFMVSDDTPYCLTKREVQLTGFARHDALIKQAQRINPTKINRVLVMPTWRGSLSDHRRGNRDSLAHFAESEYAQQWGGLLCNESLHDSLNAYGMRLVLMPHPNIVPFLSVFRIPKNVEVLTKADVRIQNLFCESALMITDYSSVAFDMALIRRPVIYFQFDHAQFYSGDHNWREGYFDYERDGFGPVCLTEGAVSTQVAKILANGAQPDSMYLHRMRYALPDHDGRACERIFDSMIRLNRPL